MIAAAPGILGPKPAAQRARLIVVGTIPVVIVGLTLADLIEERLRTPLVSAIALAVGAAGLLLAERFGRQNRGEETLGAGGALAMGVAQAMALVPGVSRSGATMTVGMFAGLTREAAARFSFVLGVPAILAAAAKEGLDVARAGLQADAAVLFLVG